MDRRNFIKKTIGLSVATTALSAQRSVSANEKINVGVIGLGNRGTHLTKAILKWPEIQIPYICDVDKKQFSRATAHIEEVRGTLPTRVQDMRRVLDAPEIDAVIISTGHNWHALATIWACQAGKDVFVEKPISLTLSEGKKMVDAARKYSRVVQAGTNTNSAPYFKNAVKFVRSGNLGDVHLLRAQGLRYGGPVAQPKPGEEVPVPRSLDWDMWCGPAPLVPYNPGKWWWRRWDYNLGGITDHASHQMAMIRAFINDPFPKSVFCTGGDFHFKDDRQTPDSQFATFEYNDKSILFQSADWTPYYTKPHLNMKGRDFPNWLLSSGVQILGTDAIMFIGRHGAGWQAFTKGNKLLHSEKGQPDLIPHLSNFLDCIRSRKRSIADIEEAHQAMAMCHLMNAAYRVGGQKLIFEAETQTFVDNDEANKLLHREGRKPWLIPKEV